MIIVITIKSLNAPRGIDTLNLKVPLIVVNACRSCLYDPKQLKHKGLSSLSAALLPKMTCFA